MIKFAAGIFVGIVIATVGLNGVANIVDNGINQTKTVIKEQAK